jgi:hypothetical protein
VGLISLPALRVLSRREVQNGGDGLLAVDVMGELSLSISESFKFMSHLNVLAPRFYPSPSLGANATNCASANSATRAGAAFLNCGASGTALSILALTGTFIHMSIGDLFNITCTSTALAIQHSGKRACSI